MVLWAQGPRRRWRGSFPLAAAVTLGAATLTGCSSSGSRPSARVDAESTTADPASAAATVEGGVVAVPPDRAAQLLDSGIDDLVVLDVRTAEEFAAGHLAGAQLIDFYGDDFAQRIGELDRDAPYVLYCRSGNRSGQTRELMAQLGFREVYDVAGGIVAWKADGLPVER
ncbi:MAG: rhodanese-like domain-containing protein [Acidimicrobiia bacterium]|nr:rhodanese-like domain-containing protein [Acidimicrobiia bacterium]